MSNDKKLEEFNEAVYTMTSSNNMPRITKSEPASMSSEDMEEIFAING